MKMLHCLVSILLFLSILSCHSQSDNQPPLSKESDSSSPTPKKGPYWPEQFFPDKTGDTIILETWLVRDSEEAYQSGILEAEILEAGGFPKNAYQGFPWGKFSLGENLSVYVLESPTGMAGTGFDLYIYDDEKGEFLPDPHYTVESAYTEIDEERSLECWETGRCLIIPSTNKMSILTTAGTWGNDPEECGHSLQHSWEEFADGKWTAIPPPADTSIYAREDERVMELLRKVW